MTKNYNITVKKTKNYAICRLCKVPIKSGDIVVKMEIQDDYNGDNSMQMQTHTNCLIRKLTKETLNLKETDLSNEVKKYKKIQEMFNGK